VRDRVITSNNPVNWTDPEGLEPRSTLGGDDPGFENPEEMIKELEKRLKDECLSQKEKEKIRRRIQELRRRKSNRQQHHYENTDPSLFDREFWERTTGLTGAALTIYIIISEGSRLFPPRNLVPVP
jgi:hypothetical protein